MDALRTASLKESANLSIAPLPYCIAPLLETEPCTVSLDTYTAACAAVDRTRHLLHSHPYNAVPDDVLDLLTLAACAKSLTAYALSCSCSGDEEEKWSWVRVAVRALDMAVITTGGRRLSDAIMAAIDALVASIPYENDFIPPGDAFHGADIEIDGIAVLRFVNPIPRQKHVSAIEFIDLLSLPTTHQHPLILTHCLDYTDAMSQWSKPSYWLYMVRERIVPVEIGRRYTDEDWTQKIMPFSEYLHRHILSRENEVGYLAQWNLFHQVPQLAKDLPTPDYCALAPPPSLASPEYIPVVRRNIWMGPSNTISPMHHDPDRNLLAQIVGCKYIRIYHPTANVYPHSGPDASTGSELLGNTSQVEDVEGTGKLDEFPGFRELECWECVLRPGEMLYIPPLWWHYVRSLSSSISTSFWF